MIDFSTLQGLTIPEGVVTQIADASGRVLWKYSSAPATVAVTMQSDITGNYSFGVFTVGYRTADGSYYNISSAGTYNLPVGTVIEFTVKPDKECSGEIFINDETVARGSYGGSADYTHTLTDNIIIYCMPNPTGGIIYITEIPEGHALVTVPRYSPLTSTSVTYSTPNGDIGSLNAAGEYVLPIGTCIEINSASDGRYGRAAYVNDVLVADEKAGKKFEYYYQITTSIEFSVYNSGDDYFYITENFAVNLNTVPNGTLTATAMAYYGSTVTLTPTADEGYAYNGAIVTYTINGVEQTINLDAKTTTFTMPAADVTVTPVWIEAKPVTITVTGTHGADSNVGIMYNGIYQDPSTTFTANVGDTIICSTIECWRYQYLYLNGVLLESGSGENDLRYEYTVVSDAVIDLNVIENSGYSSAKRGRDGIIRITEIPEGHALVTITDAGGLARYREVEIDGVSYSTNTSLVVPIGTIITCYARNEDGGSCYIYLNGSTVATGGSQQATYDYAVNGNAIVKLDSVGMSGYVYITEVLVAFTIDSTTYFAQENMTWAQWFASSHNTTGKTADDVSTITDSNGNTVNLTDIIVGGTAYEVGFVENAVITITGSGSINQCYIAIDGTKYYNATTVEVPIGTVIICNVYYRKCSCGEEGGSGIYLNNQKASPTYIGSSAYSTFYDYTVTGNATIRLSYTDKDCKECDKAYYDSYIYITEQ